MKTRWHVSKNGDAITLYLTYPPRFDFSAVTVLPRGHPLRLAHQIRQDLWRALRHVRGFSPVIRLDPIPLGWSVTAGGRIMGKVAPTILERAETVLGDEKNRARWLKFAGLRS